MKKEFTITWREEPFIKCIGWFFAYPNEEVSLNELSKKVSMSKTSVRKIVLRLIKDGFLVNQELGGVWRLKVNKTHYYSKTLKISFNLENILMSNIVDEIKETYPGSRAIILFGSYRKGDDIEGSDVDIAVELLGKKEVEIKELKILPKLGYRDNVKVNLLIFSRKKIDINLFSNVANGIVLEGFLEVNP